MNTNNLCTDGLDTSNFSQPCGYKNFGDISQVFTDLPMLQYKADGGNIFPGGVVMSPLDSNERGIPIMYASEDNSVYKGFSYLFRWPGLERGYPNTANVATTDPWVYAGSLMIRWKQNNIPV